MIQMLLMTLELTKSLGDKISWKQYV